MSINKTSLVHVVLGHSYLVYCASLIIGLVIELMRPVHVSFPGITGIGFVLLFAGPLLILWAQYTSERLAVKRVTTGMKMTHEDFYQGPYKFTRGPTHVGLFLLILGVGFIFNSVAIISTTIIAFVITRYIFLSAEEKILEERYGNEYTIYKHRVKI